MSKLMEFFEKYKQLAIPIIPLSGKKPVLEGWQKMPKEAVWAETEKWIGCGGCNLGIRLDDVVNIDIDLPEMAGILFQYKFPQTSVVCHRGSRKVDSILSCQERGHIYFKKPSWITKTEKITLAECLQRPDLLPGEFLKRLDNLGMDERELKKKTILEIRSGSGSQTVVPPSIHPDGDQYLWHNFDAFGSLPEFPQDFWELFQKMKNLFRPQAEPQEKEVHYDRKVNDTEFKALVLDILEKSYDCSDNEAWYRLAYSLRSAGFSYEEVDRVFSPWSGYNLEENRKIYNKLKPRVITFDYAVSKAKKANETEFLARLKSIPIPCKFCGNPILFNEDRRPVNGDGTPHLCKKKAEARETKEIEHSHAPQIRIVDGSLPDQIDQAEKILMERLRMNGNGNGERIFQKNGILIRIVEGGKKKMGIERDEKSLYLIDVDANNLVEQFTRAIRWEKFDSRMDDFRVVDCPKKIAETYLSRKEWGIPELSGMIGAPTLRPDGSILDKQGYDEETGLLFVPGNLRDCKIPENPTKKDAIKAMEKIWNVLKEFPFVEREDASVAVSAILTGLIRQTLPTAPLHSFSAPHPGSGKTLLADLVSLIATGKFVTKVSQPKTKEEEDKVFCSLLIGGDPIVCIDNISRPVESDVLCTILSEQKYKGRLLGKSQMLDLATNVFWLASGNNLIFRGDITTRCLLCNINARVEDPTSRTFEIKNIREYTLEHRKELVEAGLTILRAYHLQTEKINLPNYGRFEIWSRRVREAMVWGGMEDPCKSRKKIERGDSVRDELFEFLFAWYECFGSEPKVMLEVKKWFDTAVGDKKEKFLWAVPRNKNKKDGDVDWKSLPYFMRKYVGRIERGYCLQCEERTENGTPWFVVNLGEEKAIKEACKLIWQGEDEKEVVAKVKYFSEIKEEEKNKLWGKIFDSMRKEKPAL